MNLSLRIIINEQGETRDLELGPSTSVGRSSTNRIQIQQGYISSHHAEIIRNDSGEYVVSDLGSKNGTFINDQSITEPTLLSEGDVLRFGLAACQVVDVDSSDESASVATLPPLAPPARMVIKGGSRAYFANRQGLVPRKASAKPEKKKVYLATKAATKGRFGRPSYDPFASSKAG